MKRLAISFCMIYNIVFLSIFAFSVSSAYCEWHFQDSGTTETLNDVDFVDELHGWAVGNGSTILATNDGGETWKKQECPYENVEFKKVHFENINIGYCMGRSRDMPFPLLKTKNGGKTWISNESSFHVDFNSFDLSFIDEDTGWVIGEDNETYKLGIYHTKDGGDSWELQFRLNNDYPIRSIDFIDKNTGWALYGPGDTYADTFVLRTMDGGSNWNDVGIISGFHSQVYAITSDTLWASEFGVVRSYDGGKTWSDPIFFGGGNTLKFLSVFDGQRAYGFFNHNSLRYTHDGGTTFKEIFTVPYETFFCYSLMAVSLDHVCCVGSNGKIIKYSRQSSSVQNECIKIHNPIELKQNTPNPFNASTMITFSISSHEIVLLIVYDVTGRLVATLISQKLSPGIYTYPWDGKDENGVNVASGVYLYDVKTPNFVTHKKMLLLR